jgi:hypothetical protein
VWTTLFGSRSKQKRPGRKRPLTVKEAFGPPLTPEELGGNLSDLERNLNADMICPAGKNQVYIRSLLTGNGTTQPRIALKCSLRRDIGLEPEVFYGHIRDVCACDPEQCPAYRHFRQRLRDL